MLNLKKKLLYLRYRRWYFVGRYKIKRKIIKAAKTGIVKVMIGSNNTIIDGWITTDLPHFDITKKTDWEYFFSKFHVDKFLAEHVLEHIAEDKVNDIFTNAIAFLKRGGIFRIAVPDGFNPDKEYIDNVKPNGNHPEWGHQTLWTYKTLKEKAPIGFNVVIQEYYDEFGKFHTRNFSFDDGYIQRCDFNLREKKTIERSLILDLVKK